VLIQEEMIARVRQLCQQDGRVVAALMYGSFTKGEGDAYSDIEFYIFLDDATYDAVDPAAWAAQVAPVALYFTNEFGTGTAIFENLVRGEFHFERASEMGAIRSWKQGGSLPNPDSMLLMDGTGELTEHLRYLSGPGPDRAAPEHVTWLWHSFLNWMLFGSNVLTRGERARALEILSILQRYLLWLARVQEGTTQHWLTPSKNAEHDLSPDAYQRFTACTADLRGDNLERAYAAAWDWGKELIYALARKHALNLPVALMDALGLCLTERVRDDDVTPLSQQASSWKEARS
jgi:lincosamide nucleotidyltransferase